MCAGPLVVTYSLTERSRQIIAEELDLKNRVLYWTDRGDPPRGNTVNRASIDNSQVSPRSWSLTSWRGSVSRSIFQTIACS
jgi:hypothetical protein